jgi:hypothetical protein
LGIIGPQTTTEPTALVAATPVTDTLAFASIVTEPTALVAATPVTDILEKHVNVTVPTAPVPETPVTVTSLGALPKPAMELSASGEKPSI